MNQFARLQTTANQYGWSAGVQDFIARAARKLASTRALRLVELELTTAGSAGDVGWRPLTLEEQLRMADDASLDLEAPFVLDAHARGDLCGAIFVDGAPVHYEYFSARATAIDSRLWIQATQDDVFGYKAFTHPDFRGRRLHQLAVSALSRYFAERGKRAIVSHIASNNFASIRSHERAGFQDLGQVVIVDRPDGPSIFMSPACYVRDIRVFEQCTRTA